MSSDTKILDYTYTRICLTGTKSCTSKVADNPQCSFLAPRVVDMHCRALVACNKYTTTLHAINSCIVKTGKLTCASKVYRGISGLSLPKEFWAKNEFGVTGGVEQDPGLRFNSPEPGELAFSEFVLEISK